MRWLLLAGSWRTNVSNDATQKEREEVQTMGELSNGGRRYRMIVPGQRPGWSAHYVKEVDKNEETFTFTQEIYNDKNELVETHGKYPEDTGHEKVIL